MRFDKLTIKAQEAFAEAQRLASDRGNPAVEPEHLLLALLQQGDGVVAPIMEKIGIDGELIAAELEQRLGSMPQVEIGAK